MIEQNVSTMFWSCCHFHIDALSLFLPSCSQLTVAKTLSQDLVKSVVGMFRDQISEFVGAYHGAAQLINSDLTWLALRSKEVCTVFSTFQES